MAIAISARILENRKKGSLRGPGGASGPIGILGPEGASEGPGLFGPRNFLWSPSSDLLDEKRPVGASKAWLFCADQPRPLTKVILSKQAGRPIGYRDFRIVKRGGVYNNWHQPFGMLSVIG